MCHLCLFLLQIAMQFRLDEDDAVQQLLHYSILVFIVCLCDFLELDVRLLVHRSLRIRRGPSVLIIGGQMSARQNVKLSERTDASNALNSCSFAFLYSPISFVASVRASLSFCTRSAIYASFSDVKTG